MYKVVVTDHVFNDLNRERKILEEINAKVYDYNGKVKEEIINALKDADAVLTTFFKSFNKDLIRQLDKCKVIVKYGIGLDTIDIDSADEKGIMVVNVPDYCLDEVSDHAVALSLALVRKVLISHSRIKETLEYSPIHLLPIKALGDMTAGIIGFGRIGRLTAKKLSAFGTRIVFYDPYVAGNYKDETISADNLPLDKLLETSDLIILNAPATKENYHMINWDALCKTTKKPYIVNVARGELIDNKALIKAVEDGIISGAALDVAENMPPVHKDDPFLYNNRIILTPHSAWYSERSLIKLQENAAYEVLRALKGERLLSLSIMVSS